MPIFFSLYCTCISQKSVQGAPEYFHENYLCLLILVTESSFFLSLFVPLNCQTHVD